MPNRTDLLELEETFRQLFRKAKACWNTFEAEGLTASQALMLQKLDEEGPLKASQLADALWITAGAVTSFSDKLISGGYARRSRSEEDRRVVYLEITDKGRDMLGLIRQHRKKVTERFFGSLPPEDVQHLVRIFKDIVQQLDEDGQPPECSGR